MALMHKGTSPATLEANRANSLTRHRRAYRAPGRHRFRSRNWPPIGARVARSRRIGDLIFTNEAGMLFDIRHFHFWNSRKAGMLLKTRRLSIESRNVIDDKRG